MKKAFPILFLLCAVCFAQQPYSVLIDKSSGLPSNSVYNLLQDSKGYIWIASNVGLTRYDGFEYITYKSAEQTSTPGSNIQEDKFGRIWYQNFDGYLYYVENDSLKALNQKPPQGFYLFYLNEEKLFVVGIQQLHIYALSNLELIESKKLSFNQPYSSIGFNNSFYLITDSFLLKFDEIGNLSSIALHDYFLPNTFKQLYTNGENLFLTEKFNESKQLFQLVNSKFESIENLNTENFIQGLYFNENEKWILTTNGISIYEKNENQTLFQKKMLPNVSVSSVLKDRQNNFWIGSNVNGIHFVPNISNEAVSFDYRNLHKILKLDSTFIITTLQGEIVGYNPISNKTNFLYQNKQKTPYSHIFFDELNKNLLLVSKEIEFIEALNFRNVEIIPTAIKKMIKVDEKYYAYGGSDLSGLFINEKNSSINSSWDTHFEQNKHPSTEGITGEFGGKRTKTIAYLKYFNALYYGTSDGLYEVTPNSKNEILFNNKKIYASYLLSHENLIIIQTTLGELIIIEKKNDSFKFTQFEDLNINSVSNIKIFNKKLYYIHEKNLHEIDLENKNFSPQKLYTAISAAEINDYLIDNNTLYVLTNNNLISFNLNNKFNNQEEPNFYINFIKVNGIKTSFDEITNLKYFQNFLEINYSILNFGKIETPIYYKLNEEKWRLLPSETRVLTFPSLASGKYKLFFKVGEESPEIDWYVYSFTIALPFWKKWWFYFIIIASVLVLAFLYYRYKLKNYKEQIALLEKNFILEKNLSNSILTSIKSQMNPHFFYNALNTIQSYIFKNDKKNASKYLNKFSKLTRTILEMSDKEKISLNEEITALNLYLELEKMRFNEDFNFELEVDKNIETDFCLIPSMLIQPYVENAIKHGLLHSNNDKFLSVKFLKDVDNIKVIIEDNGIGIEKSKEINKLSKNKNESFSTGANEKRLAILNKDNPNMVNVQYENLKDEYNNSVGTKVTLSITTQ